LLFSFSLQRKNSVWSNPSDLEDLEMYAELDDDDVALFAVAHNPTCTSAPGKTAATSTGPRHIEINTNTFAQQSDPEPQSHEL
jgi:hypothetical protein